MTCTGSEPVKTAYGINYKPTLRIVKWAPRPADLPDKSPADPADIWTAGALAAPARSHPPQLPTPRPRHDELATEF